MIHANPLYSAAKKITLARLAGIHHTLDTIRNSHLERLPLNEHEPH